MFLPHRMNLANFISQSCKKKLLCLKSDLSIFTRWYFSSHFCADWFPCTCVFYLQLYLARFRAKRKKYLKTSFRWFLKIDEKRSGFRAKGKNVSDEYKWSLLCCSGGWPWRRFDVHNGPHQGVVVSGTHRAAVILVIIATSRSSSGENDVIRHSISSRCRLEWQQQHKDWLNWWNGKDFMKIMHGNQLQEKKLELHSPQILPPKLIRHHAALLCKQPESAKHELRVLKNKENISS